MARKNPFTEEQIRVLEQNKFTHHVSPNRIVFTLEFKEFFMEQRTIHKKSAPAILKEAGYDISFFSRGNIDSIRRHIVDEAESDSGLKTPRGLSSEQKIAAFEAKNLAQQRTEVTIKEMQERIVHLEKQVEFLKKTSRIRNS